MLTDNLKLYTITVHEKDGKFYWESSYDDGTTLEDHVGWNDLDAALSDANRARRAMKRMKERNKNGNLGRKSNGKG